MWETSVFRPYFYAHIVLWNKYMNSVQLILMEKNNILIFFFFFFFQMYG